MGNTSYKRLEHIVDYRSDLTRSFGVSTYVNNSHNTCLLHKLLNAQLGAIFESSMQVAMSNRFAGSSSFAAELVKYDSLPA